MIDTKKIKEHLPRNYSKMLQKRIHEKTGKLYSLITITSCMNDNPKRINQVIIEEAAIWAAELKQRREQIAEMVDNL